MNLKKFRELNIITKCSKIEALQLVKHLKRLGYHWYNKQSLYPSNGFYEINYIQINYNSTYLTIHHSYDEDKILLIDYIDMIYLLNSIKD